MLQPLARGLRGPLRTTDGMQLCRRVPSPLNGRATHNRNVGHYHALAGDGGSGNGGRPVNKHLGGNDGESGGGSQAAQLSWALLLAFGAGSLTAGPAHALRLRKKKQPPPQSPDVNRLIDLAYPVLKNLGFSGFLGAVAGICLKTVGRSLAVAVGIIFGIIQVGAYLGYVRVDWARVHRDVLKTLDVNRDGKFDATDLKALAASLLAVLAQGVPSIGGFSAGVGLGLRL